MTNLYYGLYDKRASRRQLDEVERHEEIRDLVDRVSPVLKEEVMERCLPLAEDKEERFVLWGGGGRRGKRGDREKVK